MAINPTEFRAALSRFPSGVTVVTTKDAAGKFHGITVSAFCSVSLDPPLILVCIEKTTCSHTAFEQSRSFVVNFLRSSQSDLSERFASQSSDKFQGLDFRPGIDGVPIVEGCIANLECLLRNSYDGGDHTIFVGEVENVEIRDGEPLIYFHSTYGSIAG